MEVHQSTLYVLTQGAYVRKDHLSLVVEVDKKEALRVPIHLVESVVLFGNIMASPGALSLAAEHGASVSYLTEWGRMQARVDAPSGGNVLVRREQYRRADNATYCTEYAARFVAGKLHNCRGLLLRAARESQTEIDAEPLRKAATYLGLCIGMLEKAVSVDEVRGHEGNGARVYFSEFSRMIKPSKRSEFAMTKRTRQPPLDSLNCLLGFLYGLLSHDCAAAAMAAGLDASVGYLHTDRPGRPSLALDLMEEFRPLLAERLALTLINRQQISSKDFVVREGGAVELKDESRRMLVKAWQDRKREETFHPLLNIKTRLGMIPFLQARLLARQLRGEIEAYSPCIPKI